MKNIYFLLIFSFMFFNFKPILSANSDYSWVDEILEISAEGKLAIPGTNIAQDKILIKEATRAAAYQEITDLIFLLPIDEKRIILDLIEQSDELEEELYCWITRNAIFTEFHYSSPSTGLTKLSLSGAELSAFIRKYDILLETKEEKIPDVPKEQKDKTQLLKINIELVVSPDRAMENKEFYANKEAEFQKLAKEKLLERIQTGEADKLIELRSWLENHPDIEPVLWQRIKENINIQPPKWNEDKTILRTTVQFEFRYIDEIIKNIKENKSELEQINQQPQPNPELY